MRKFLSSSGESRAAAENKEIELWSAWVLQFRPVAHRSSKSLEDNKVKNDINSQKKLSVESWQSQREFYFCFLCWIIFWKITCHWDARVSTTSTLRTLNMNYFRRGRRKIESITHSIVKCEMNKTNIKLHVW